MLKWCLAWLALVAAPLAPSISQEAQATAAPVAENERPPTIPVSAFASRSQFSGARLSPNGARFAFSAKRDKATYISIYNAETLEIIDGVNLGEEQDFNWFRWAGNDRIIFSMTGRDRRDQISLSRLYYLDLAELQLHPLVGNNMSLDGDDVVHIDDEGRFILLSFATQYGRPPAVWRFDLGGTEPPRPVRIESEQSSVSLWIADASGNVRIAVGARWQGRAFMRYRSNAEDDWTTVARTRLDEDDELDLWDFMGLRAGSNQGYSIGVPPGGERSVLMEYDFATGTRGAIVYQSEDEDVSGVTFDRQNNPIAVAYYGDEFRREWLDPEIRDWRRKLGEALPGSRITILDVTQDRSRMLVLQSGAADPGALYVFTPAELRLDLFADYRPELSANWLSEPRPIRYEARDGLSIQAYLTLPKGREPTGLPLIVYPHGGPYGVRDRDVYDDSVQVLANRGYAVIQPNFRGSGGYGQRFEELGEGEVGRAMQDDLDDAVAHLVAQGIVDPQRVCIVGASYGGFAAVWGAIRNPEIYRCAASFAGVMHYERQLAHDSDYLYGRRRGRHLRRIDGDQTNFDLDDVSPAVQVERLARPVLLVHGKKDNRVPFDQFELMVRRAANAGIKLETLALEESGHGFSGPEEEEAYYEALTNFLSRHNPADY